MAQLIFAQGSGEILAAHLLGAEVSELIHGLALAISLEATDHELIAAVFPHPRLSEAVKEAALAAQGRAITI